MAKSFIWLLVVFLFCTTSASAQFEKLFENLGFGKKDERLSGEKVASGLKEALFIGTENAVKQTGSLDGYFKHEVIKILMPEKLQKMDRVLRVSGFGDELDEFVLSMNRAAELAAPEAREIFWDAIKGMTIMDAHGILSGGDTAATDFFKEKTTGDLTEAFSPIVKRALDEVGVTRQYKDLVAGFERIPFMSSQSLDLDAYVVEHALEGLFYVVGEEETKIRKNPAARVTDLLREVFSL